MRWSWLLLATALCGSAACTMGDATSNAAALTDRVVCFEVTQAAAHATAAHAAAAHAMGGAACERAAATRLPASIARMREPIIDRSSIIDRSRRGSTVPEPVSSEGADDDREA